MDLQHDRIREACQALKLDALIDAYPQLAAKAVSNQLTFPDFLESLLKSEYSEPCRPPIPTHVGHPLKGVVTRDN